MLNSIEINKIYEEKYLKYKNKYLDLKEYLSKMNGGVVQCPKIGFHQHEGECWHDALSTSLLFTDGISEDIQELFNVKDISELQIHGKSLNELSILGNDKIPLSILPLNFEYSDKKDRDTLITYVKSYITNMYNRYNNEKKPLDISIFKIATKADKKVQIYKESPYRQESFDLSLACVEGIFNIVAHNNINPRLYDKEDHGGATVHTLITLNIISYFLLNTPNKKPHYFLNFSIFDIEEIFNNNSMESIKKNLENMIKILDDTICVEINLFSMYDTFTDEYTEMEDIDTYYKSFIGIKNRNGKDIDPTDNGHSQCFYKCGGKEKYYDDNGINPFQFNNNTNLSIDFNWKKYLREIIEEILSTITEENKSDFFSKFSKMYFDEQYGIKYKKTNKTRIYKFKLIRKIEYIKENQINNLAENFDIYINNYNNNNIQRIIKDSKFDKNNLNIYLCTAINECNLEILSVLLTKPNISESFNLTSTNVYIPLNLVILNFSFKRLFNNKIKYGKITNSMEKIDLYKRYKNKYIEMFNKLMDHPDINICFNNQEFGGDTSLLYAINECNLEIVSKLLEHKDISKCFNLVNDVNFTPLLAAIYQYGKITTIEEYKIELELEGKVHKEDTELELELEKKYISENSKIVNKLLEHPNINICFDIKDNDYDHIPLTALIKNNELNLIQKILKIPEIEKSFLIDNRNGEIPLSIAISNIPLSKTDSTYQISLDILKELLKHEKIKTSFTYQNKKNSLQTVLHKVLLIKDEFIRVIVLEELLKIKGIEESFDLKNNYKTPMSPKEYALKKLKMNLMKKYEEVNKIKK